MITATPQMPSSLAPATPQPPGSTVPAPRKRTRRSKVTNGTALMLGDGDDRSFWSVRMRDLFASHLSDLGGPDNNLSEGQISICRRVSVLEVQLELIESRLSRGDGIPSDMDQYTRMAGCLKRCLDAVGLKRVSKQAQTLGQVWMEANAEWEAEIERNKAAKALPVGCTEDPAICNLSSCPCSDQGAA